MRSKTSDPLVSLGLPVFNGEAFLAIALESIAHQTFRDFDLLILDNASTDRTSEIARDFVASHSFARYARHDSNLGAAENFNQTFHQTEGTLFKWVAADDVLDPRYLEMCVRTYEQASEAVVNVFARRRFIDHQGRWLGDCPFQPSERRFLGDRQIGVPSYRELVRLENNVAPAIVFGLMRRDALRRTRLIGAYRAADCVLNAELRLLGEHWQIPERLHTQRRHAPDSWRAMLSKREQATWYAPRVVGGARFPQSRLLLEYLRSVWRLEPDRRIRAARLLDLGAFVGIRLRRTLQKHFFSVLRRLRVAMLRRTGPRARIVRLWLFSRALARMPRTRRLEELARPWSVPTSRVLADLLGPLVAARKPEALDLLDAWLSDDVRTEIHLSAAEIVLREFMPDDAARSIGGSP